jgi:hypothetical protein
MTDKDHPSKSKTPLPGAVMPLAEEEKLIRKPAVKSNDNWSMRGGKRSCKTVGSQDHYSDQDDKDQTIPI